MEAPTLMIVRCSLACLLLALAVVAGCRDSNYDLVRVSGIVTLDGAPLEGAAVKFQPRGGGIMSYATTDAEGRYELRTMDDQPGAMVATHVVSIYKSSGNVDLTTEEAQPAVRQLIPERYNHRSELEYEVKSGDRKSADFALTSK